MRSKATTLTQALQDIAEVHGKHMSVRRSELFEERLIARVGEAFAIDACEALHEEERFPSLGRIMNQALTCLAAFERRLAANGFARVHAPARIGTEPWYLDVTTGDNVYRRDHKLIDEGGQRYRRVPILDLAGRMCEQIQRVDFDALEGGTKMVLLGTYESDDRGMWFFVPRGSRLEDHPLTNQADPPAREIAKRTAAIVARMRPAQPESDAVRRARLRQDAIRLENRLRTRGGDGAAQIES